MSATLARRQTASLAAALCCALLAAVPRPADAQWSTTYDQFYLPDRTNWAFRNNYPAADRLFNAFDYGHAILYETLYRKPNADPSILEEREYDFVTRKLLVDPPRIPVEEAAIEVEYAKLAPEAKAMFDWAHVLHRRVYDIWADERVPVADKDVRIARVLAYYKSRRDLAFSSVPKNMDLMEGQYYSGAFRDGYPKFNGLIWGYHWLQVGLYEPLVSATSLEQRQTGVLAAVGRFRQMLENPPEHLPRVMPMTAAVAPRFSQRYPEIAIIFDNLHAMHDVISDILASPKVPRDRKRAEILTAAARYRDSTSFAMTRQEWSEMAQMMGVANMGGPAVGFLADFPTPTVPRGATMAEAMKTMDHGAHRSPASDSTTKDRGTDSTAAGGAHRHEASAPAAGAGTPKSSATPAAKPPARATARPGAPARGKAPTKRATRAPAKASTKPATKPAAKPAPKPEPQQPQGHVH
jgi:hypothetical protein